MTIRETFLEKSELAEQLGVTERTLDRWWAERVGPPRSYIGRRPVYSKIGAEKWIKSRELVAVRDSGAEAA